MQTSRGASPELGMLDCVPQTVVMSTQRYEIGWRYWAWNLAKSTCRLGPPKQNPAPGRYEVEHCEKVPQRVARGNEHKSEKTARRSSESCSSGPWDARGKIVVTAAVV